MCNTTQIIVADITVDELSQNSHCYTKKKGMET